MPIKPENKKLYPPNWKQISEYIRFERAKNKCEFCGVNNYIRGFWIENKFVTIEQILIELETTGNTQIDNFSIEKKPIKIILTVAHLDHNPSNCDYSNLKALCQKCHNNYDRVHRNHTRLNNKNKGMLKLEL